MPARARATANNIDLFYLDTRSNYQSILCLHGKWGRGETWSDFMERYRDRYRVIAPDQRGHGISAKPIARYASEDFACDMYEFIKTLSLDEVIVVGHSMGGQNAGFLAALYPEVVKAIAILDQQVSGPETRSDRDPAEIPAVDELTAPWPTPFATYDAAVTFLRKQFKYESNVRYFLDSLREDEDGYDFLFSPYAIAAISEYQQSWYHILERITCPIMLVRAAESWSLPKEEAETMRKLIKNCMYFEVSNSDHMVYADNPDDFYPQFDTFLASL